MRSIREQATDNPGLTSREFRRCHPASHDMTESASPEESGRSYMTRLVGCGTLVACVLCVLAGTAQQQPIFRGSGDVVRVFSTVTDRDGRLVTSLTRDNFEVRDEGKPQEI